MFDRFSPLLALLMVATSYAAEIPEDYQLVYEQDFTGDGCLDDFRFTDPNAWRRGTSKAGDTYMEQFQASKYEYKVRSPYNIALLTKHRVKDFVLDLELQQTGKEYGHRDMCVFFGFQDRSHFYYAHIASKTDDHAHNIFVVNDKPRTKISSKTTAGHNWTDQWHTVRLTRNSGDGTTEVFVDNLDKPIMSARDTTFDWGYVGIGTFDDTGRIRRLKLWAPESRPGEEGRAIFKE
jgi:hypothetical protein